MHKLTSESGAPDNSSQSHFSATTLPCWLRRVARKQYHTPSSRRRVDGVEVMIYTLDATSGCGGNFIGVVTSSSTQNAGACKLPADVGLGGSVRGGSGVDGGDAVFPSSTRSPREEDGLRDRPRVLEDFGAGGGEAGSW